MKKVFSKEKWIKKEILTNNFPINKNEIDELVELLGWPNECDGLTEEEMNKLGYLTRQNWMVEVEEDE